MLKRSKKDIKNVDHMMINHDIATVSEGVETMTKFYNQVEKMACDGGI